ncbi:MAG: hypothetical protein IPK81_24180 [Rhodospirillales bacterium]|nr:MAG: hypothetical protein IPK81_24180 [Rhodospirillales bacterium]
MTLSRRSALAAAALAGVPRMASAQGPGRGGALYDLVARYSARPHHRTGTPEAAATLDWMDAELVARGARVERRAYAFERYEHRASVSIDGRRVESLPLYYEGVGEIASEAPFLRPVTLANNFDKADLAAALREAAASGAAAAVFATFGRFGAEAPRPNLIAVNVDPDKRVSGIPTLLVSGEHLDSLAGGSVFAGLSARRVPDRADNLIARLGPADGARDRRHDTADRLVLVRRRARHRRGDRVGIGAGPRAHAAGRRRGDVRARARQPRPAAPAGRRVRRQAARRRASRRVGRGRHRRRRWRHAAGAVAPGGVQPSA